jgi:hypothetical protein
MHDETLRLTRGVFYCSAKVALDRWLTSQKSAISVRHSGGKGTEKLKAVQEED